eukprot:TRINITY_DN469_c0_g3_i1.p1 TRINITY_DN469_c0_g3~~TRINITY_DN469_c0_g3_i1.p1  ORF type:complete len:383 (+),score=73.87 TRINITY_DN469_c0_g3_i1:81-1151(+)
MLGAAAYSALGGAVGGVSGTALYNACMGRPVPSRGRCAAAAASGAVCGAACGAIAVGTGHTVLGESVKNNLVTKSDGDTRGLCLDATMNMNLLCACSCMVVDLWTGREIRRLRRLALTPPEGTFWDYCPSAPEDSFGMGDRVCVSDVERQGEIACRVHPHRKVQCTACSGTGAAGEGDCPFCEASGYVLVEQDGEPSESYLVRFVCTSRCLGFSMEVPVAVVLAGSDLSHAPPPPPRGAGCLVRSGSGVLFRSLSEEHIEDIRGTQVPAIRIGTPRGRHCAVCWEETADVHFSPCRHVCCCPRCAERVYPECPICRGDVSRMRQVHPARTAAARSKLAQEGEAAPKPSESCVCCSG